MAEHITEDEFEALVADFHYTGGPFNGYDFLGYIGNDARNYVTDAWVLAGANELGWMLAELSEWLISKWGRFALDAQPLTPAEMRLEMAKADLAALLAEAVES